MLRHFNQVEDLCPKYTENSISVDDIGDADCPYCLAETRGLLTQPAGPMCAHSEPCECYDYGYEDGQMAGKETVCLEIRRAMDTGR